LKKSKLNVTWGLDGEEVSYSMFQRYFFEEDLSISTDDVEIVNINPCYMGVLQQTGGELQLTIAFTGKYNSHKISKYTIQGQHFKVF
jgi:hypothetical protein